VLGVKPGASEEEIKQAYRTLAKKWHPDQYANTPQYDSAMEKMKEINTAYDALTGKNADSGGGYGGAYGGYGGSAGYGSSGAYSSDYTQDGDERTARGRVRLMINAGDFMSAEQLLLRLSEHNAEWHYLMGYILAGTGRYDAARIHLRQAVEMDPQNPEYRSARDQFEAQSSQFRGRTFGGSGSNDAFCRVMQCLALSSICSGGGYGLWPLCCFCR
jgi:curved DNA-binding protein CbpA